METLKVELPDRLFKFDDAKVALKQMIDTWNGKITEQARVNRAQRKPDLDIEALQKSKVLDEDETIIPIRTINTNIEREQGTYLAYFMQPQRIVTLSNPSNPTEDCQAQESIFTRGMTYDGWLKVHAAVIDGCQTHGWDTYEVVPDETKPFHVGVEQVGYENMIFPLDTIDIQHCEMLIRLYSVTLLKLEEFVAKKGFNGIEVNRIKDKLTDNKKNENITIFKVLFKFDGFVYTAWFELGTTDDWLREPKKLFLGRQEKVIEDIPISIPLAEETPWVEQILNETPISIAEGRNALNTTISMPQWVEAFEVDYPFFMLFYEISENKKIIEHKGRAFWDKPSQEGQTAIASSIVNGCIRASQVFGSPATNSGSGRPRVLEEVRLEGGRMYDNEVKFWNMPWPEPVLLNSLQVLGIQNAQEAGQTNFAAANKKDSRKTAKELSLAEREQDKISGVKLINLSTTTRTLYTFIWKLVCSRAQAGLIKVFGNLQISPDFDVRAAGDVDVVERSEKLRKMQQDWPVLATTPIADLFLKEYIKVSYPDYFEKWSAVLEQGDPQKVWIQKILTVLPSLLTPEEIAQMDPNIQQQLKQLVLEGQQALQKP